ncbi:MOSC domain-containing protein [Novosphingobium sp.]|uniref:MOSC domain-containing protein n=1 Tax=Novosphingobium sp. TaxID=1874826 RepID=UPI003D0A7CBC
MTMRVAAIWRYPVKSLGGQEVPSAAIEARGVAHDRRWMVTTPEGRFLTRRELPAMAHIHAAPVIGAGIVLSHRDGTSLAVPVPDNAPLVQVRVWGDHVAAHDAGDPAAQWLSALLGQAVRLVHLPDGVRRPVADGEVTDHVSFADGFPLLVTVTASLDALNRELASPIPMARFRPNLVIEGAPGAFAEDGWQRLQIGNVSVRVVRPCTRCVITTQDVDTGEVIDRLEPLRTLRAMGRVMPGEGKLREPIFGRNAIPDGLGTIAVGDVVAIIA